MKSRAEVAAVIETLLENNWPVPSDKHYRQHFGRVELRSILDFIYGGPPAPGEGLESPGIKDNL
jgi:hypothetical protein